MTVTVLGLSRCDTCRKACRWLQRFDIDYHFVDLREQRPEVEQLLDWARQAGGWEILVNKAGTTWRNLLPQRKRPATDAEWTLLLREYPALLRRPLLVFEDGRLQQRFSNNAYQKLFADKLEDAASRRRERAECGELRSE